jgi:dihydroorotate dehydrogenase
MYQRLKPLLFNMDPEQVHDLVLGIMRAAGSLGPLRRLLRKLYSPRKMQSIDFAGLKFNNQVGLAAGFDKNGTAWRGLSALGFSHIELGTVTPRAQVGNPKPRIFRFPSEEALINQMGFPGKGMDFVVNNIPYPGSSKERDSIILGINIGKNKDTPNQEAFQDYLKCLQAFFGKADYCVINVSSPNTLGLRDLQAKDHLRTLLSMLVNERDRFIVESGISFPIFVKLSPDLSDKELDDALEALTEAPADGVIATNTTIQREGFLRSDPGIQGGLSGLPLKELSTMMIKKIHHRTSGSVPIIGVGGIHSPEDALEKLDAGAGLIQIYTGMIYQGPVLVRDLIEGLA